MQYSPKLKMAMEDIKLILDKYDIAGLVVLHTPGHSEYLMKVNPSYSCAKIEGDNIRIRAKLADFNGDKKAWTEKVSDTSNMLRLLGETSANLSLGIFDVSDKVDKIVNAEHSEGGHTSHTQQNN